MTLASSPSMGPPTFSDNTQAVLLLTSPLLARGSEASSGAKVLSAGEYGELAIILWQTRHQPADLLNGGRDELIASLSGRFDPDRLYQLLSRGFQLGQAIEHWANRSITVIGRADEAYPKRYKQRLKHLAPPLLYVSGNLTLLNQPALAVVGSRSTPEVLLQQTTKIASLAASAGVVITSGAARGVDEAAMLGALNAGGHAVGVVADSLEKISAKSSWRQALIDGHLLLLSVEAPSARFQTWRAMARNKLIYALADSALVVSSDKDRGGTWDGAKEQLTKLRHCPIHVMDDPRGGEGLPAIHEMGAPLWPYPSSPEQLKELVLEKPKPTLNVSTGSKDTGLDLTSDLLQKSLWEPVTTSPGVQSSKHNQTIALAINSKRVKINKQDPVSVSISADHIYSACEELAEELLAAAKKAILKALEQPQTEANLAELLKVTKAQAKEWCKALADQGYIQKIRSRPVTYQKC